MDDVKRLYEGMACIADEFDCAIVGGDTTSWFGQAGDRRRHAGRADVASRADPRCDARNRRRDLRGGPLGGSIAGRHLTFTPRLELASRLVLEPELHALMDLSDRALHDLHRMCAASRCDAELSAEAIEEVVSSSTRTLASEDGIRPIEHALNDGEDFELLVAGGQGLPANELGLVRVGRMTAPSQEGKTTICLCDRQGRFSFIEPRGYEHFR